MLKFTLYTILFICACLLFLNLPLNAQEASKLDEEELLEIFLQKKEEAEESLKRIREVIEALSGVEVGTSEETGTYGESAEQSVEPFYEEEEKPVTESVIIVLPEKETVKEEELREEKLREEAKLREKELREKMARELREAAAIKRTLLAAERAKKRARKIELRSMRNSEIEEMKRVRKYSAKVVRHSSGEQKTSAIDVKNIVSKELFNRYWRHSRIALSHDFLNNSRVHTYNYDVRYAMFGLMYDITIERLFLDFKYRFDRKLLFSPFFGVSINFVDDIGRLGLSDFFNSSTRLNLGFDLVIGGFIEPRCSLEYRLDNTVGLSAGIAIKFDRR